MFMRLQGISKSKAFLVLILTLATCFIIISIPTSSKSRVWLVRADGTGDAPTIQAGVDSAIAGDTVLVAPGVYKEIIRIKQGICLISKLGADQTKIILDPDPDTYYAIVGLNIDYDIHRTEINGFWVQGVTWGNLGAITLSNCKNTWVLNNILTGNSTGVFMSLGGKVTLMNNTFYGNSQYGIDASDGGEGNMMFNVIWDRADGLLSKIFSAANDFMNLSDAYPYEVNNFSLDPEFCGATAGNFYLQSDSPCAPENPPYDGMLIGALPVNCSTVSVENKTWGAIKSIYRE